jgi:hypothetical protein
VLARIAFSLHSDHNEKPFPAEEWEWTDRAVYDLSAEAEKIAGRARA